MKKQVVKLEPPRESTVAPTVPMAATSPAVKKKVRLKPAQADPAQLDSVQSAPLQSDPASLHAVNSAINELRLQRLRDLLQDALAERNPLQSNLRAATGDMMSLAYQLQQAISKSLDGESRDILRFEEIAPSIEMYLKLTRQADRFAQIDFKLGEGRQGKTAIT